MRTDRRCVATTQAGAQCARLAQRDGLCLQHAAGRLAGEPIPSPAVSAPDFPKPHPVSVKATIT